jgi:hypothetical protein
MSAHDRTAPGWHSSLLLRFGPRAIDKHARDGPKGFEFCGEITDTQ